MIFLSDVYNNIFFLGEEEFQCIYQGTDDWKEILMYSRNFLKNKLGCRYATIWMNRKLRTFFSILNYRTCPISSRLCSIDCIGQTRVVHSRTVWGIEITRRSNRTPRGSRGVHYYRAHTGEQHRPQNSQCHGGLKLKVY